ncbi:MAG: bL21 family ribosomal protein [Patescibacteria group bacterium]|nr:bL21 family ribosomal protein [Patescibacteria group bacterium]
MKILRFKAKVRYRKRKGFRPYLTTLKIIKI